MYRQRLYRSRNQPDDEDEAKINGGIAHLKPPPATMAELKAANQLLPPLDVHNYYNGRSLAEVVVETEGYRRPGTWPNDLAVVSQRIETVTSVASSINAMERKIASYGVTIAGFQGGLPLEQVTL